MKFFKCAKEDKNKGAFAGGLIGFGGGLITAGIEDIQDPKVFHVKSVHPTDEVSDALKGVKNYKELTYENFKNKKFVRKGDVIISNYSSSFNALKNNNNSVYIAADQGNAPKDIKNFIDKNPEQDLNWGTDFSNKAKHIVGTKGLTPEKDQKVLYVDWLPSDNVPIPSKKVSINNSKKQVGLSYGNASQSGTIFGLKDPIYSPYKRTKEGTVLQPKSKLNTQHFEKILEGLDNHYGKDAYELEVFTGTDKDVHHLLKEKNYRNINLTEKIPKDIFLNKVYSKDLMFTNPGLNLVSMAKSDYKIPTILLDTDERAAHNANFKENINWFKGQQENARDLKVQDISKNDALLPTAIKEVESAKIQAKQCALINLDLRMK